MEKWKKLMLWIAVFSLFTLPFLAHGKDISDVFCEDVIQIGSNCTMHTPVLSCSAYTYDIYNLSDGVVIIEEGILTEVGGSIYKLNFTNIEHAGNYVVKLCDGTSRGIIVEGEEVDYGLALVAALIGAAFICIYLANSIKHLGVWGEKQWHVDIFKSILWLFGIGFVMFAVGSTKQLISESGVSNTLLENSAIGATLLTTRLFYVILVVFFILFALRLVWNIMKRRKEKEKDEEGEYEDY